MLLRRLFFSLVLFSVMLPVGMTLLPAKAEAAAFGLVPCALRNDDQATTFDERGPCTVCHLLIGMERIVTLLRNIMTAIAVAVIVAMAIVYITSAGDEGRMSFAKEGIKWSLIGFTVILLAWVMVNFIFTLPLFANNGLVRTDWDSFTCNTTSQSQAGSTTVAARSSSSISNATGSNDGSGPTRGGTPGPGAQPPVTGGGGGGGDTGGGGGDTGGGTGGGNNPPVGSCNNNGICEHTTNWDSETCASCPGDCGACTSVPVCGSTHYTCAAGTYDGNGSQNNDGWGWDCLGGIHHGDPFVTCIENITGCGNNKVESSVGEQCDTGAARGVCPYECSWTCQINDCSNTPPPTPVACGPSNGTSSAPVDPLCVGEGAIASSVTVSAVGTSSRYDWTCSKDGLSGSLSCSSGRTSVGGNPTATCGPAAGVASVDAPSSGLCGTGELGIYGVNPLIHAVTGEPLWYWGCVMSRSQGGTQTSCYAPRIVP